MNLCVIGTGYVGLVAGTCFAESGNDVICVDIDERKITDLRSGKVPIYEPGLEELIRRNMADERLRFTTDFAAAVKEGMVCFIAVGTPSDIDGSADVRMVLQAATDIARAMPGYRIIVLKSTVPVGTADRVRETLAANTTHPFDVVSNPEFLKEGAAVEDFMKPDRVVIGGNSERALSLIKELYAPFVRTENPILVMDNRSAEMTKYAANAFLATRISFINQVANLCEKVGADVAEVRRGIGFDRRIGHYFLFPGVGYGGSCFPKDVRAVIRTAEESGMDFTLLREVEAVNERQKHLLVEKVHARFGADLRGRKFAIWAKLLPS
jgi:UDPglucose 6-dehydrogenase